MKIRIALFLLLAVIVSCKEESVESIKTTAEDLKEIVSELYQYPKFTISNPENVFIFDDGQDQILETKKMSRIYISKNSFVDKNGKDVQGKIEVKFKEYHSTGEILASKLPMVYKSPDGKTQQFESAGMFEITANQNGEELKLKKDKKIQVDLASENSGSYNFYNFNETEMVWEEKDTKCLPIKNAVKLELLKAQDSITNVKLEKPKKPIELSEKDEIFDINMDFERNSVIGDLNGVMWKMTEENDSVKKAAREVLFSKKFDAVRLEPLENENLEFNLIFVQKNDTVAFKAAPVMKGKLLSQQKDKYQGLIANIEKQAKKLNRIQDQLKREKDLLRSFNVDQLGIYNYDRQWKDENAIQLLANFTFEDNPKSTEMDEVCVYLIPASKKVVVQYTKETFEFFAINLKENNKLIAVFPNNQVYYLSNKDIQQLNLSTYEGEKIDIQMKKHSKISESKELDQLIAKI